MATAFPSVPGDDVWGAQLIQGIETRDDDVLVAAQDYADSLVSGAPTIVLGPQDPIPVNTPAGTIIFRTT